jgi:hypothetical protein
LGGWAVPLGLTLLAALVRPLRGLQEPTLSLRP